MVTRVPIDAKTAKWARKRCHLSESDAATMLKCDVETLRKIESGDLKPTAVMFRNMAARYLLPEATLLGLEPTEDRPLPKDFRSFDGAAVRLSYRTIRTVRLAQARQEALARLAEIDETIEPPTLPLLSLASDPEKEGTKFRRGFGFDVQTQLAVTPAKAFILWRTMVEQLGISVYVEPLGEDGTRGVSDSFNGFPTIVIDQSEKHSGARLFTLFHELAHHFVRQVGISNFSNSNTVERFCNRFAAAFLMPTEAMKIVLPTAGAGKAVPAIAELAEAARRLCVTISQIALRMEDLGLAPRGYYRDVKAALSKPTPGQPKYQYTYLSQYGENLSSCVLRALDAGLISSVEASRAMNTSPDHFASIRQALKLRRVEPADASGR